MNFLQEHWDNLYNFSEEDIKINAAGSMTEKQRKGYSLILYRFAPIGAVFFIIFPTLITQFTMRGLRPSPNLETQQTIFVSFVALVVVCFYLFLAIFWWRLRGDVNDNRVLQVSGLAQVGKYRFTINQVGFWTSTVIPIEDGKSYRVYYLPRTTIILSFEELE